MQQTCFRPSIPTQAFLMFRTQYIKKLKMKPLMYNKNNSEIASTFYQDRFSRLSFNLLHLFLMP